jgi:hypothetical protein
VLEVAENNRNALKFYRARQFQKLDAALFLAKRVSTDDELLPPRPLKPAPPATPKAAKASPAARRATPKKPPPA